MTSTFLAGDARQTLDLFRRSVDQLFENVYGLPAESGRAVLPNGGQWTFSPVIETAWGDSNLQLRAILPGVAQQDLKVSVQNNQLIIGRRAEDARKLQEQRARATCVRQVLHGDYVAERFER